MTTVALSEQTGTMNIKKRTKEAAKHYLQLKGYEVRGSWESGNQFGYLAMDEWGVAFVRLLSNDIEEPGLPEESAITREEFEQVACKVLASNENRDMVDMAVRFDVLSLKVLCADRVLMRHHINVLGAPGKLARTC